MKPLKRIVAGDIAGFVFLPSPLQVPGAGWGRYIPDWFWSRIRVPYYNYKAEWQHEIR